MNGRGPVILVGLCVVAAAVVSGWPGLDNGFLNFDDPDVIESNERLDSPTIVDAVDVFGEVRDHAYLPLYYLFLMPDAYDGKDPRNFHIGSLIWHALAGVLILALMWRLTARLLPAAAAALLFVCHPISVESVAWASGRKDQVSLVFLCLGLLAWLRWLRVGGRLPLFAAAGLLFLGCFAKGTVVVFPALAALMLVWERGQGRIDASRPAWKGVGLLSALAVIPIVVHLWIAQEEGTAGAGATHGMGEGAQLFLAALGHYGQHLLLPIRLSIHYHLPAGQPFAMEHFMGVMVLAILGVGAVAAARGRGGLVALALAWMLIALAPFNNVFPRTSVPMADRYLAAVLPGFGLLIGALLQRLPPRGGVAGLAALVAVTGWLSFERTPEFRDGATVFERAMELQPDDPVPPAMIAEAMLADRPGTDDRGRVLELMRLSVSLAVKTDDPVRIMRARLRLADTLLRSGRWKDAEDAFVLVRDAYASDPDRFRSLGVDPVVLEHNHAQCLIGRGMLQIGKGMLMDLLKRVPKHPESRLTIAGIFIRLGFDDLRRFKDPLLRDRARLKVVRGLTDLEALMDEIRAGEHKDVAAEIEPEILKELGDATLAADWREGRYSKVNDCVDLLIERFPTNPHGYSLRASVELALNGKEARGVMADLQRAYFFDPEDPQTCVRLCRHYMSVGKNRAARTHLEYMHRVRPQEESVKVALAELYLSQARAHHNEGRGDFALLAAEAAIALVPDGIEIWVLIGQIQENAGNWSDAGKSYRKALALDANYKDARLGAARHHQYMGLQRLAGIRGKVSRAPEADRAALEKEERLKVLASYRNALTYAAGAKDVAMARRYLREHRQKGKDASRDLRQQGERQVMAGDLDLGIELLRKAVAVDGLDVEAWWTMGMGLHKRRALAKDRATRNRDRDEALRCFEEVLSLDPEHLGALRMTCDLYYVRGEWRDLERMARRFLVISTDVPELAGDRAVVEKRLAEATER